MKWDYSYSNTWHLSTTQYVCDARKSNIYLLKCLTNTYVVLNNVWHTKDSILIEIAAVLLGFLFYLCIFCFAPLADFKWTGLFFWKRWAQVRIQNITIYNTIFMLQMWHSVLTNKIYATLTKHLQVSVTIKYMKFPYLFN